MSGKQQPVMALFFIALVVGVIGWALPGKTPAYTSNVQSGSQTATTFDTSVNGWCMGFRMTITPTNHAPVVILSYLAGYDNVSGVSIFFKMWRTTSSAQAPTTPTTCTSSLGRGSLFLAGTMFFNVAGTPGGIKTIAMSGTDPNTLIGTTYYYYIQLLWNQAGTPQLWTETVGSQTITGMDV